MTILEALLILGAMGLFLILLIVFVIKWMGKNNLLIEVSKMKDGSFIVESMRGREVDGKIYSLRQFFIREKTKPFSHPNGMPFYTEKIQDQFLAIESMPLIGVKRVLKLKHHEVYNRLAKKKTLLYMSHVPPTKINFEVGGFTTNDITWMNSTRDILYKETENKLSKEELIHQIAINVGLVLLAICLIIFYPKIHETVVNPALAQLQSQTTSWVDALRGSTRLG